MEKEKRIQCSRGFMCLSRRCREFLSLLLILSLCFCGQEAPAAQASRTYVRSLVLKKSHVSMEAGISVKVRYQVRCKGKASDKISCRSLNTAVAGVSVRKREIIITGRSAGSTKVRVTTAGRKRNKKKITKYIRVQVSGQEAVSESAVPSATVKPVIVQTATPSVKPSSIPSKELLPSPNTVSAAPSSDASESPSAGASESPSAIPSGSPSAAPSSVPSADASETPVPSASGWPEVSSAPDMPDGLTLNGNAFADQEITLYALDSSYGEVLSVPDSLDTDFTLAVSGTEEEVRFQKISGNSVTLTSDGYIEPSTTTWYWKGGMGTTSVPADLTGYTVEVSHNFGTSVIRVTAGGQTCTVTVTVLNYAVQYADDILQKFIDENITDQMTGKEKVTAITKYTAQEYGYDYHYSSYVPMVIHGGGDCWGSTSMIVKLCTLCGIKARSHSANWESGAGSGHYNAIAEADGVIYKLEAGFSGSKPRSYGVTEFTDGYQYTVRDGGVWLNEFETFEESLEEVQIPEMIAEKPVLGISRQIFYDVVYTNKIDIRKITVPKTVKSLSEMSFFTGRDCIESVTVDTENENYCDAGGAVYSKDKKKLVFVPASTEGTFRVDPATEEIGAYAASYCDKITQLILPEGLTTIGESAFRNMTGLTSVAIPSTVTKLDTGAFYCSSSLTQVELPESVADIGQYAFYGCDGLKLTVQNDTAVFGTYVLSGKAVLRGKDGSTAQAYAAENQITFEVI